MELLSIIVPAYNAEKYICEMLDCLVDQTYEKKEVIVVDDGSTDSTGEMCDRYAEKYDFVRVIHKKNGGVYSARNAGLEASQGMYIAFVDADDGVDAQTYEIAINALESSDSDIAVFAHTTEFSDFVCNNFYTNTNDYSIYDFGDKVRIAEGETHHPSGYIWNKLLKRQAIGNLRFKGHCGICDDMVFGYELISRIQRLVYINIPLYHYRFVIGGLTQGKNIERQIESIEALRKLENWCLKNAPQFRKGAIIGFLDFNVKLCELMLRAKDNAQYEYAKTNLR